MFNQLQRRAYVRQYLKRKKYINDFQKVALYSYGFFVWITKRLGLLFQLIGRSRSQSPTWFLFPVMYQSDRVPILSKIENKMHIFHATIKYLYDVSHAFIQILIHKTHPL